MPSLSFVAVADGRVVGNVMNSWVGIEGSDARLLQLSPLGVRPDVQRQGHGAALVRASLDGVRALGEPLLLVEGNPRYYGRFGFVRADELGLLPPSEALYDWAFQVAVLDEGARATAGSRDVLGAVSGTERGDRAASSAANALASFATFRALRRRRLRSMEIVTSTRKRLLLPPRYARGGAEYTESMATLETGEKHQGLLDELLADIASL